MCGRYYVEPTDAAEDLAGILDALNRKGQQVKTGEIFPSDLVPVLANTRTLTPAPFAMAWGFRAPDGRLIINARSETAAERPMFRDGMLQRRCLFPATHYFEWEKRGSQKIKYAIRPDSRETLYMAGLYRLEGDQARCTILTRAPSDRIAFIHDRMPVILPQGAVSDWLSPRYEAADVLRAAVTAVSFTPVQGVDQLTFTP